MMESQSDFYIPDQLGPAKPTVVLPTVLSQVQDNGQYHHHQPSASQITTPWNVRTPYACGEVKQLTHEIVRYSWDILGMAKVRCTGCSEISMEEAHKLCYSGKDSRHQQGVGFVVNKNKLKSVISCTPKSSRLISIRVATWPWNVTIIQVYARRMDYDDDKVEKFHEELENTIKEMPKRLECQSRAGCMSIKSEQSHRSFMV